MVEILQVFIVLNLCQQNSPTFDELFPKAAPPDIVNVRRVSESESVLKPCQAFTIMFEVTLAGEALRTQWPKITRKASNLVRVNGHAYKNMLSGAGSTNDACVFKLLWPQPIGREPPPPSAKSALIAATCQIDLKERACLFREPGDHRLEFFFGDQTLETTVQVAAPTLVERQIIARLSKIPMFFLLLDPTNRQYATPENIAELAALLDPPSDYTDLLSMTIGVAKGRRVGRPRWTELTDEQKHAELEERYGLLERVATLEQLTTPLEALAAFELANVGMQLSHLVGEIPKRAEYKDLQTRLFQKVADCPLVPREQALAKQAMQGRARYGE